MNEEGVFRFRADRVQAGVIRASKIEASAVYVGYDPDIGSSRWICSRCKQPYAPGHLCKGKLDD